MVFSVVDGLAWSERDIWSYVGQTFRKFEKFQDFRF